MTVKKSLKVTKRNNKQEEFDVDKIHKVIGWAIEGIQGVSLSDIAMNAALQLHDGIGTTDIHKIIIKSAADLISEEEPNYQYVAARLLLYSLRKDVWGCNEPPRLLEHVKQQVANGVYESFILENYSESEINKLGNKIKHDRDTRFTFAGLQTLVDKYLVKNRFTHKIYETPQFAYMMIAMTLFAKYSPETRTDYVLRCYDHLSKHKINLPTPIMSGVRTVQRQYASCCLIDIDDTMESIFVSGVPSVALYTGARSGIGLNMGRIRPIGEQIRQGEVVSTGNIPFLKVMESTVKSCSQNGIRGGGATVSYPFWHSEIMDILVLKNNAGTDDNRVRKLDYCIQFSRLFYERFKNNEDITLFSPNEAKGLYEAFGTPAFDALYIKHEANTKLKFRKKINARELAESFTKERLETGRYYLMNVDHVNTHSSWKETVHMTNLCCEITQPTIPLQSIDDPNGEIGVCVLSAINMLEIKDDAELESVCDIIVRLLDAVIDHQGYPILAAKNFTKKRRSLGVGLTNLAGYLAKHKARYDTGDAYILVDTFVESMQYFLLKASCQMAKEVGPCEKFGLTKYADGILPIDTYNKNVDGIVDRALSHDWEALRKDIVAHGLRHSTLTAQMPCESSSIIQNSTNGIEPVRRLLSYKKSQMGIIPQVVPNFHHCRS